MFQAQGLVSGLIEMKTTKLLTQQILKQAPKISELETMSMMDSKLCQGHVTPAQQSARIKKEMTPFERNINPSVTFGVSNKK